MRVSSRRSVASLAFLALSLGIAAPTRVRADDPSPVEVRIFDLSALAAGMPRFVLERGPFPVRPDEVNNEELPLFGREDEESVHAFGTIDELVDRVRRIDPEALSPVGVISVEGGRRIILKAPLSLQQRVSDGLAELERLAFPVATIDVLALRGDPSSIREGGLSDAIARGALVPLAGARASGFAPGKVAGRCGSDATFVQDEDVEVANEAKGADPIVGLLKDGLAFDADLVAVRSDRVTTRVSAWWAATEAPRRMNIAPGGDPVERVDAEGRDVEALLDLVPGVWTVLASTGDVVFAVRATVRTNEAKSPLPAALPMAAELPRGGPNVTRTFDIEDLGLRVTSTRGQRPGLYPSNFTPPESPELPEPRPAFTPSSLVELVRATTNPSYWESGESSLETNIEASEQRIVVTANAAHVDAFAHCLAHVRASIGKPTRFRATVVMLPIVSFPEYFAGIDDGATLLADGGQALLARPGAKIVDRGGVRCRPSERNASVGGKARSYIADFDVEIAGGSIIGKPLPRTVLDGYSFDVSNRTLAGGAVAVVELRLDRTNWLSVREVTTPHGAIECPTIGVSRIRGGTLVPIGARRLVGASLFGGVVTLTVLAATAE